MKVPALFAITLVMVAKPALAEPKLATKVQQDDAQAMLAKNLNNRTAVEVLARLHKEGLSTLELSIDWPHWDTSRFENAEYAIGLCEAVVDGLDRLHQVEGWKQALDKTVRKVDCRFDGTHPATTGDQNEDQINQAKDVELKGSTIVFHLHERHANAGPIVAFALRRDLENVRIDGLKPAQYQARASLAGNPANTLRSLEYANASCGTKIEMVFDWAHFEEKEWINFGTAISQCDDIAEGVRNYCNLRGQDTDWAGRKQVQQKIKKIECRFDGKHACSPRVDSTAEMMKDIELVGSTIVMHLDMNQCSLDLGSRLLQKTFGK